MADILTLTEARVAVQKGAATTLNDAELEGTYIPATTHVVEDLAGPIMVHAGLTWTVDGGRSAVVLPSRVVSVQSVTADGTTVDSGTYRVDTEAGMVVLTAGLFPGGVRNIVVTYTTGAYATAAAVPAHIKLAARIILAHMWRADQQGGNPAAAGLVATPSGYLIPHRAAELLAGSHPLPGMA